MIPTYNIHAPEGNKMKNENILLPIRKSCQGFITYQRLHWIEWKFPLPSSHWYSTYAPGDDHTARDIVTAFFSHLFPLPVLLLAYISEMVDPQD